MRLLRWLFVLFALMYAPALAGDLKGGTGTDPVVPPGVEEPYKVPGAPEPYKAPGTPGGNPKIDIPELSPELKGVADALPAAPKPVLFPDASTIPRASSMCQMNRDDTFGKNTPLFNPGKTMENATAIYNALPCPTTWLAQTVKAISSAKLPEYISKLAFAVWFLGIIWTGVRIANGSERADGRELFARLLISGWLVFGSATNSDQLSQPKFTGNMGEFVRATWVEAYDWGDQTFATPALKRAAEQTANLGEHISKLVTLYAGLQVISEAVKSGAQGAVASTVTTGNPFTGGIAGLLMGGASGAGNAVAATTQAGILAVNMVMPILLTYYLVITGTGIATVIASMLLPLVGAMFVFGTGLGMQFAETWFKTAASAVLMMALMPVFFTASLELGFVEPARNFDRATTRTEVSLQEDFDNIEKLAKENKISWGEEMWNKLVNVTQAAWNKLDAVGYLNAMLTSLVLMAFSLIAGMYTLRIAQNWIIEFLSGVASAVSGGGSPNFGKAISAGAGAAGNAVSAASAAKSASGAKGGIATAKATYMAKQPTNTPGGGSSVPTKGGQPVGPGKSGGGGGGGGGGKPEGPYGRISESPSTAKYGENIQVPKFSQEGLKYQSPKPVKPT